MASVGHDPQVEEEIHLPEPTIWPFILAIGITFLPVGTLMMVQQHAAAGFALGFGVVLSGIAGIGWISTVIKEKYEIDQNWGNRSLSMAWKLFLVSEAAIFGAFFGHYFYMMYNAPSWPPTGTPHIHLVIPAIGTGILVFSSLTAHFGHVALIRGHRGACKSWIIFTILLGFTFMALQGYEWGYLQSYYGFTMASGYVGTAFYLITGFHGAHVLTGLLLLLLVYFRLETGSFDRKRHFSMNAASWYWHFVDVIWLFVFFSLYISLQ